MHSVRPGSGAPARRDHEVKGGGLSSADRADLGDARDLARFADGAFDAVLCMGPLYHLAGDDERRGCLRECHAYRRAAGSGLPERRCPLADGRTAAGPGTATARRSAMAWKDSTVARRHDSSAMVEDTRHERLGRGGRQIGQEEKGYAARVWNKPAPRRDTPRQAARRVREFPRASMPACPPQGHRPGPGHRMG
ncbi:MAG: class I SAM-dependent methyltransferase [Patescibacteria group bacterium]